MGLLIAGSLLAFGGAAAFTAIPVMAACAVIALLCGVRIATRSATRALDLTILALLGAIGLQAVPLPPSLIAIFSPNLPSFFAHVTLLPYDQLPGRASAHSLSLDAASTLYSLALMTAICLVFWASRRVLDDGGTRRLVRAIASLGLFVAVGSIILRAASPHLIYGFWPTAHESGEPMGPFVNRNHYATWMLMTFPLVMSYLLMRIDARPPARHDRRPWTTRAAEAFDGRSIWLGAAALVMVLSIFVAGSRAGVLSVVVSSLVGGIATGRVLKGVSRVWLAVGLVGLLILLGTYADINALFERWDQTFRAQGAEGRLVIWRDTMTAIRDFWFAGTGAGTYQMSMLVYQVALRGVNYFNHAHNQYLHIASEGGLLLVLPTLAAIGLLGALVRRRIREDQSVTRWLRIGAATGLFSVALQSVWETGLRMPANAILFAVLCAIAVHQPGRPDPEKASRTPQTADPEVRRRATEDAGGGAEPEGGRRRRVKKQY